MKNSLVPKIIKYFKRQPAVKLVYLYGSQARDEARKDSDIDLAVLFTQKKNLNTFKLQAQLSVELSSLLGKKTEVQNLGAADISFAYRVVSEGKLIYCPSPEDKVFYETYLARQYFDLKPGYDEYFSLLAERARKGLISKTAYQL